MMLEKNVFEIVERTKSFSEEFFNKSFLITGATGLVGSTVVKTLLEYNRRYNAGIAITIISRNKNNAKGFFAGEKITVLSNDDEVDGTIDYIVHCAAPTQSLFFVEKPVETLDAIIFGTRKMLDLARRKKTKKFLNISSMEAYGFFPEKRVIEEKDLGIISLRATRSSYPEAKRVAELYTYCYGEEYGVPVVNARLAMCFGAGVRADDKRVHKSFCEDALDGRDIVVKSTGETVVNYVYITDAVVGILLLLLQGAAGETYNVSGNTNGETIMDMAKIVARFGGVGVKQELASGEFAPDNKMILSNEKMWELGWRPRYNLVNALDRYFEYLAEIRK